MINPSPTPPWSLLTGDCAATCQAYQPIIISFRHVIKAIFGLFVNDFAF